MKNFKLLKTFNYYRNVTAKAQKDLVAKIWLAVFLMCKTTSVHLWNSRHKKWDEQTIPNISNLLRLMNRLLRSCCVKKGSKNIKCDHNCCLLHKSLQLNKIKACNTWERLSCCYRTVGICQSAERERVVALALLPGTKCMPLRAFALQKLTLCWKQTRPQI